MRSPSQRPNHPPHRLSQYLKSDRLEKARTLSHHSHANPWAFRSMPWLHQTCLPWPTYSLITGRVYLPPVCRNRLERRIHRWILNQCFVRHPNQKKSTIVNTHLLLNSCRPCRPLPLRLFHHRFLYHVNPPANLTGLRYWSSRANPIVIRSRLLIENITLVTDHNHLLQH